MVEKIAYAHIEQNSDGVPYLTGTKIQVKQVALDHIAYQWTAEDIQRNHPHLSLSQIHSALAYYYDHKEELDNAIEEGLQRAEHIKAELGESPLRLKLKAHGAIS